VTGALMFAGGVFVQMLEGEAADVEVVFERICRDMRHRRLVLLDFSSADERMFEGWGMVAFEGDERVRALFPTMGDATSFAHRNPMSANTAVQMMQALLAKRLSRPKRSGMQHLIATNIAAD
jgi:Sensors of blue-light using FAD